jgi:CheY-like chemotaxis protein
MPAAGPNAIPTVLIVDDDPQILELEHQILESAGYRVVRATEGPVAIARLALGTYDLLIADLDMPDMNGAEMVRRVRTMRPDLKVLYVTGHIDTLMDTRSLWEGEAFLEKPFTLDSLRESVSFLLYGTATKPPTS